MVRTMFVERKVLQYQIVQKSGTEFEVKIVPVPGWIWRGMKR